MSTAEPIAIDTHRHLEASIDPHKGMRGLRGARELLEQPALEGFEAHEARSLTPNESATRLPKLV